MTATLLLVLIVGLRGFGEGCGATLQLREGIVPDVTAVAKQARDQGDPLRFLLLVSEAAKAQALAGHRSLTVPLSVARMLLGGLLFVAGALAMNGRRGSRGLLLQALFAGAAFAGLEYALTSGVRGAWIDMLVRACAMLPEDLPDRQSWTDPALWWMAERVRLVAFDVGLLAVAALALTRRRATAYFRAAAAAAEDEEETGGP